MNYSSCFQNETNRNRDTYDTTSARFCIPLRSSPWRQHSKSGRMYPAKCLP